ncbi:MAG: YbhB/YbcL family Raf kinase inhibitor-like protein [Sandaracinaceae bacterium]|jgi:Raf kinase inhibitor-like YbhB/YbcL family protein|nr:YbhB/YbcL family Raf kinase inhibitor-like protein [Sandaracinaceae bacterium]MBK7776793.1 YbhB/YbcL family Raf kinase inhibitor-like protein [Sandaracinaceae bacterium]MBK8590443.1 YbhB/YbcL family Raf kinase inhibitor-like protein [Sandaracinaceae bacterium]MBP7681029.1 YbhB/YbcL family Raf kinase inhibitor-like protein [Deltaproteobacteria bacterium]
MDLRSDSFEHNAPIPARCAFGTYDAESHVRLSDNKSPHLAWSDAPDSTQSYVVICTDFDAPSKADDVNQEGRTVPYDLPRVAFHHWALVDVPASKTTLAEGEFGVGVTPRGKSGPDSAGGTRSGLNGYTEWFAGDADMGGQYFGYDGPCPPWNDERLHRYQFVVYALDVPRAPVEGTFRVEQVLEAIAPHVVAKAGIAGTYQINPDAK